MVLCVDGATVCGAGTCGRDLTATGLPYDRDALKEWWTSWLQGVFRDQPLWFSSLTFRDRVLPWSSTTLKPTPSLVRRAGSKLEELLTTRQGSVSFFSVMEAGSWNGRLHLHSLLSSPESVNIREALAEHESRFGFTKLQEVTSRSGVTDYVLKYVLKESDPWWAAGGPLWRK